MNGPTNKLVLFIHCVKYKATPRHESVFKAFLRNHSMQSKTHPVSHTGNMDNNQIHFRTNYALEFPIKSLQMQTHSRFKKIADTCIRMYTANI